MVVARQERSGIGIVFIGGRLDVTGEDERPAIGEKIVLIQAVPVDDLIRIDRFAGCAVYITKVSFKIPVAVIVVTEGSPDGIVELVFTVVEALKEGGSGKHLDDLRLQAVETGGPRKG